MLYTRDHENRLQQKYKKKKNAYARHGEIKQKKITIILCKIQTVFLYYGNYVRELNYTSLPDT